MVISLVSAVVSAVSAGVALGCVTTTAGTVTGSAITLISCIGGVAVGAGATYAIAQSNKK